MSRRSRTFGLRRRSGHEPGGLVGGGPPHRTPVQVSFLPAFWLLVPGSLGLVGLTQLLGDQRVDAVTTLISTGTTMIGISFGVLIGLAIGSAPTRRLVRPPAQRLPSDVEAPATTSPSGSSDFAG